MINISLVDHNRETGLYIFIDRSCGRIWEIHTSVRTVAPVNGAAEAVSPGSVVHTLVSVKRHPECHLGAVGTASGIWAGEHIRALLVGDGIDAGVGGSVRRSSGHAGGVHDALSVNVEPHFLIGYADLHIGISDVVLGRIPAHGSVGIHRFSGDGLAILQILQKLLLLFVKIDLPAVVAAVSVDLRPEEVVKSLAAPMVLYLLPSSST